MPSFNGRAAAGCICVFVFVGCNLSDPLEGTAPDDNNAADLGRADARTDGDGISAACGNGTLDPGETCDGDCESSCDDGDPCTDDLASGSAATCDFVCASTAIAGCTGELCGNGTVDDGETCDGNCPTCDDGDICTNDQTTGDASTCDVVCTNTAIAGCVDPSNCGNGVLDPGELCDGDCPDCDDGDACTTDVTVGASTTCDKACANNAITMCVNGDGCCAPGCDFTNDNDCVCVPKTCAGEGQACGLLDDGCGQTLVCGPCGPFESCLGTQCMASRGVGDACVDTMGCSQLPNGKCIDQTTTGFPNGYCSTNCGADSDCPMGTDCVANYSSCFQSCTDDSECRPQYACVDRDGDGDTECAPVGTGANAVGQGCVLVSDCSGAAAAVCQPVMADGRWLGGYCTRACTADVNCGAGAHCATFNQCFDACQNDGECRTGHRCVDVDQDGRRECWGALRRPVGDACDANEQCAIWEPSRPTGCLLEQSSEFEGGYCTGNCSTDAECPGGSHCSQGLCKLTCVGDTQCRTPEYACYDRDRDMRLECEPIGSGSVSLGGPCTVRSDCAGGQAATCIKGDAAGRWEGGYCSAVCATDADCPNGAHCYGGQLCLGDCMTVADCRSPGFACIDGDGDSRGECFGGLDRGVGDPCMFTNDCGAATNGGFPICQPAPGYPGGYCTTACGGDGDCPTGSTCYATLFCEATCQSSADCRGGYTCIDADNDGDSECHP